MQRTKVFAIAAALVMAGAAALLFAGGASAASWHVYQGDIYAGHAYGIDVPSGAQGVEFAFEGASSGSASFAVFDPAGAKVAHYALSPALAAASIANPTPGQYVAYVYDITDGALSVRVNSEKEPALQLAAVELVRTETPLGSFPQGKLDQVITSKLSAEPVFVTLLYEGSARDLDATVASDKGTVVTITDESATAFSPGVWTTLKGERSFDAAKLSGSAYTIELHAASFEGSLVLTTLSLAVEEPQAVGVIPAPAPSNPGHPSRPVTPMWRDGSGVFGLEAGTAVAFFAPAGKLRLMDPAETERAEAAEDGDSPDYGDDCQFVHALLTLYAPDDSVLAVVQLDHDALVAEIDLPVAGEYVAFTHHAENDVILAMIDGMLAPPTLRRIALAEESFVIGPSTLLDNGEAATITLTHVPVMLGISWDPGMVGAFASAIVENEKGTVARADALLMVGSDGPFVWGADGSAEHIPNYAAGDHTVAMQGLYEGTVTVTSTYFLRDTLAEVAEPEHVDHAEHEEPPSEMPVPLSVPRVAPVPAVPALPR